MKSKHKSAMHAQESAEVDNWTAFNKQSCTLAKKLNELGWVYALYGALDGLSLSYSTVKYCFDMLCTNSCELSSDVMHDWMLTPAGIAATTLESITIIGFSLIANVYDDNDKNKFNAFIATIWPYCRDSIKGLKNTYKGVRSLTQVFSAFSNTELHNMIIPVGLLLGALSALNRIWMRKMRNDRKQMMKSNTELLLDIQSMDYNDQQTKARIQQRQIASQSSALRIKGLMSAAYGGVVDGLYLFMGSMGITTLTPSVFTAMAVISVIFTVLCVAARVYEEYSYQRDLIKTQIEIELALCSKELEFLFSHLHVLSTHASGMKMDSTPNTNDNIKEVYKNFEQQIAVFESKYKSLKDLLSSSYTAAAISGVRNGLFAYGALSSAVFAIATIYATFLATIPAFIVVGSILAGVVSVIGFTIHSLIEHYSYLHSLETRGKKIIETKEGDVKKSYALNDILRLVKEDVKKVIAHTPTEFKQAIADEIPYDPSPQFFFQEWFEVVRSFFSGMAKGQKSVDYTLNSWQEPDEHGHYRDSVIMLIISVAASSLYAVGLALRAHARGFGRPSIPEQVKENHSKVKVSPLPTVNISPEPNVEHKDSFSLPNSPTKLSAAQKSSIASRMRHGFFKIGSHRQTAGNVETTDKAPRMDLGCTCS